MADTQVPDTQEQSGNLEDRHVRSYVIRQGRITNAQKEALQTLGPKYLVPMDQDKLKAKLDFEAIFGRKAPLAVEIGFGMGRSFVQMAAADPERNYLGIEVHPPGVGAALMLVEEQGLTNVRIIQYDAFLILKHAIAEQSIDILQIFFPDPWPKARHRKRRLVNPQFIELIKPLLKDKGQIRLATDWQEYAEEMLDCLSSAKGFVNLAPGGKFMPRPDWRPLTKFEERGDRLGHGVWDVVFERDAEQD